MSKRNVIKAGTTRGQLADFYDCNVSIIIGWLEEIGVTHQKTIKPLELAKFLLHVGPPDIECEIRIPFVRVQYLEQMPIEFENVA